MQVYLYSSQDLILEGDTLCNLKAGDFYLLQINTNEVIKAYPATSSGIMVLNYDILSQSNHNQIIYHKLDEDIMLCEIKPLISFENACQYNINGGNLKTINCLNELYIYFNNKYCGCIKQKCTDIKFEKLNKQNQEYGLMLIGGIKKYLILFSNTQVLFFGQYIDYEIMSNYIQIYYHNPNIFNVGNLVKYDFNTNLLEYKSVRDRGDEYNIETSGFQVVSFLEAIKCGRYKYAYKKLSYELKAEIEVDILSQYFKRFDTYYYLSDRDCYITIYNHKITDIIHISSKDNVINRIY